MPGGGGGAKSGALPHVRYVIAVGAGKGGVGKSTIATNLAVGLARTGATVGLMDGDIYGPSLPTILGIKGRTPEMSGNKIVPFAVHGVHAVTIGSLVEAEKPLIWRGRWPTGRSSNC
jgi:ATP-binding protein involved in chromosome partitioning